MEPEEKIEKYIDGSLSHQEKEEFEQELLKDQSLLKKYELSKKINQVIANEAKKEEFKQNLQKIHHDYFASQKSKPNILQFTNYNKSWLIAASLILIIGLSVIFYYLSTSNLSTNQLYAEYNTEYKMKPTERSQSSTFDMELKKACELYNNHEYTKSKNIFEKLIVGNNSNSQLCFFYGLSLQSTNNFTEAALQFKHIIQISDIEYLQQAEWYLALNYLKQEKINEAKELLLNIAEKNGYYSKNAKELLEKMP